MMQSDFIAVHRSTSTSTSLSQQLCALLIFIRVKPVAMQKTIVGKMSADAKRWKSERQGSNRHIFLREGNVFFPDFFSW